MSKKKCYILACLLLALSLGLAGCGGNKHEGESAYQVYRVDGAETKVVATTEWLAEANSTEEEIALLITALQDVGEDTSYRAAITADMDLQGFSLLEDQLTLDFASSYASQDTIAEVLSRAAIVRTLCGIEGVSAVQFTLEGEALTNQAGSLIGSMTPEQFVDNDGSEINSYEMASLTLYFATEDGTALQSVMVDTYYNSNISLDKLVVEMLIEGPTEEEGGYYATLNPATTILSVTTSDTVCYVNLDSSVLSQSASVNVTPEVAVYSIANSLIELSTINKVQISIDGSSDTNYLGSVDLSSPLERNLDLLYTADADEADTQ